MTNLSKNTTQQAFVKAIQAEVSQVLGIQLDGQFSVIVHPQGYPYFIVYGENSYYNEATLNLVDQTICINDNGFGTFSNTRLSQLYNDILNNIEFKLSDEDQDLLKKREQCYEQVSQRVVSIYERDVEIITEKKISKSKCYPATKIGYVQYIINTKYDGCTQKLPSTLAILQSEYQIFINVSITLNQFTQQLDFAQRQLAAAKENTMFPLETNGGLQTGKDHYMIAYTGFPVVNQILDNLKNAENTLKITWEIQNLFSPQPTFSIGDENSLPATEDTIMIGFDEKDNKSLKTLGISASKIKVEIIYTGLTIISAKPLLLSTDLKTGWYSDTILSNIIIEKNTTGFHLFSDRYQAQNLFGFGKKFAFVKTFLISEEPTIQLTFYGNDLSKIESNFKQAKSFKINFADILTADALNIKSINHDTNKPLTITLTSPHSSSGTIPAQNKIAHIIGGVISYPPDQVSLTLKNYIQKIKFSDQFYLRNQNGQYIVGADKSLGLNGSQYYPRLGNTGKIALEFRGGIGNVENGMIVQIKTTEEFVGKYNVLGAWTTPSCYYYSTETNYQQQNWQIFKNNPNDKLIQDGDQVYFKNIYYKDQNLVSNGLYLTTKKDVDEFWIIEKVEDQDS
ncbi:MAG: hypothetical protein VKL60_11855 [Sphaerospermopsis sp.]|jgi:hypothetical protein|uniref:hypothetical protein n=1 Tax=Microcystis sp. M169S2 TaxID=2771157 RepID=UPI000CBEF973|nr:hypothetical protein [Microcystis sp. M169S2]MCA2718189.1 hypothetical protein [Microcystis sp. M169S2]MEB3149704.1 hypothetical protein [Sphaerospermopsis sp.]GBE74755.1 hypothetical protein myaer87_19820 [Microcystis aeruginosa NIES-87]